MRQHTPLIVVGGGQSAQLLLPLPLQAGTSGSYDEAWVRDLLFDNPETLPVNEIDPAFGPLIPICTELDTRGAGYADALYISPNGLPTLVETKLWRNPEARREVVGQILDYARALRSWTYADLQRQVALARKEQGFRLAGHVRELYPDLDEAAFVDAVTRSLSQGRMLLLIVGDGIREGVEAIAEYLQGQAGLHFTFGLVETGVFALGDSRLIVQPRVLAKTAIINRTVLDIRSPEIVVAEALGTEEEASTGEREVWMNAFWRDLRDTIRLDDAEQPLAKPGARSNVFWMFPTSGNVWLTSYFAERTRSIGVFLGLNRGSPAAMEVGKRLLAERETIDRELDLPVIWTQEPDGKVQVGLSKPYWPLRDPAHREEQLAWFRAVLNRFVNVFRPRVEALWRELNAG